MKITYIVKVWSKLLFNEKERIFFNKIKLPELLITSCYALNELSPIVEETRQIWEPIESPENMCLVTFTIGTFVTGLITHVGTCIGAGKFLHTIAKKKMSQVERLTHPYYKHKIEGFYKYAG